jgi:hypothetical protein
MLAERPKDQSLLKQSAELETLLQAPGPRHAAVKGVVE